MDTYSKNIVMMWLILGALQIACAIGYLVLRFNLVTKMDELMVEAH
jgi:hypothetical protein